MSSISPSQPLAAQGPLPLGPQGALGMPAGMEEAPVVGFGDAVRILKQRKLTIVITFVLFYLLVVGSTFAIRKWVPAFPSEGILELQPPRESLEIEPELVTPEIMKQMLQTEARKLKQLSLIMDVLQQPEIKQTEFYKWYGGNVMKCAFELQRMLVSAPIPETNLIRVSLSCRDKREAKLIVQTVISRYLLRYQTGSKGELQMRVEGLRDSMAAAQQALTDKRAEIRRFRETSEIPAMEAENSTTGQQILRLFEQVSQYEVLATSLQGYLDSLEGIPLGQLPITPEMRIIIESDPILRYYRVTVESLDVGIESLLSLLGPSHRQVKQLRIQRQGWFEKEIAKREELINDIRERQIESTRQDLINARNVILHIRGQLQELQAKQRMLDRNLQTFQQHTDDEQLIIKRIEELQKALAGAETAMLDKSREQRLSLVQPAEEAIKPSRPDMLLYLGGGFVLSLAAAIGLAFLREFTDKAIRTPIDVARYGQISVLGNVPLIDEDEADIDSIEQAALRAPQSLVAEAFRQVRTNLLFSGPSEKQRTILVTSPGPGDGKTAVAINLAVTLAQSGHRVLLIDCNFRRPAIRDAFANTRREGLSNILIGQGKLPDYVTKTDHPNVDVLSSGPMPPTPSELLGSTYVRDLIQEATQRYDRIIFDGPPALLISDALVLATQVDGVILVARAVSNSKGAIKRAREQLERIGARIFGAVLNGVQARAGGYFRKQYREFYDYASDETVPAELPGGSWPTPPNGEEPKEPPDDEKK